MLGVLLPEEVAEHLHGPCKTSARISEQQVGFESSFFHVQIPNSFRMSVVLVLLYVIKGTWSNLAIECLQAAREENVLAWFSGPCVSL